MRIHNIELDSKNNTSNEIPEFPNTTPQFGKSRSRMLSRNIISDKSDPASFGKNYPNADEPIRNIPRQINNLITVKL
uniref:Uncharacterized protein n=1 Tax=Parastrongyloides trichosuri TaxID=131310 RepID=A0A0N4Z1J6_PARTI